MGTFTEKTSVEGRTILDYGESFLHLQAEKMERLIIVQVRPDGSLFDPYQLSFGQPNQVSIYIGEFTQYITGIVEYGFVMLHNHPDASKHLPLPPSKQDHKLNETISKIARAKGKRFYNHCVIAEKAYYMKELQPNVFDV